MLKTFLASNGRTDAWRRRSAVTRKLRGEVRDDFQPLSFDGQRRSAGRVMRFPELQQICKVGIAALDADHKLAALLPLVDHWNKQIGGKTKPSVVHAKPSESFYRTTEVEEERTVNDERVDLTNRDLVRVALKFEKPQRHPSPLRHTGGTLGTINGNARQPSAIGKCLINQLACIVICCGLLAEDDLKSLGRKAVPVRVRLRAQWRTNR